MNPRSSGPALCGRFPEKPHCACARTCSISSELECLQALTPTRARTLLAETELSLQTPRSTHLRERNTSLLPVLVDLFSTGMQNDTKASNHTLHQEPKNKIEHLPTLSPEGGQGMSVAKLISHQACNPGLQLVVAFVSYAGCQL